MGCLWHCGVHAKLRLAHLSGCVVLATKSKLTPSLVREGSKKTQLLNRLKEFFLPGSESSSAHTNISTNSNDGENTD